MSGRRAARADDDGGSDEDLDEDLAVVTEDVNGMRAIFAIEY